MIRFRAGLDNNKFCYVEVDSLNTVIMTKNEFEILKNFKNLYHSIGSNTKTCKPNICKHKVVISGYDSIEYL